MSMKPIKCNYCGRRFNDETGRLSHTKAKHPGKKNPRPAPKDDDDESFADRAIAASIAIGCGEHTDDEWLLP